MNICPNCEGRKKVFLPRVYPGTHAYRPEVDCPVCLGKGEVEEKLPEHRYFLVKFEVTLPADGLAHADLLARQFVSEALSSMQYEGMLPMGESCTVIRHSAEEVSDEEEIPASCWPTAGDNPNGSEEGRLDTEPTPVD